MMFPNAEARHVTVSGTIIALEKTPREWLKNGHSVSVYDKTSETLCVMPIVEYAMAQHVYWELVKQLR